MKRIFLLLVACLFVSGVSAFPAKVGFELSDLGSVSELDNSDGSSIMVSIHEVGGGLVDSRNASKGVYEAGSVISVSGSAFDLSVNTDYIYNLSTEYGNYYYDFTTAGDYSGDKLLTKIGFELSNLEGINWLDNSDGDSVVISVQNSSGVVVRRNASVGIYHAGSTIPMEGSKYNLSYDGEYTLNLSTDYGDFLYEFRTPKDAMPDAFSFNDLNDVSLSTLHTSNMLTPGGYRGELSVSIIGEGNPQLSVNGGNWVDSSYINPGSSLQVRLTSANSYDVMRSATLTFGDYNTTWYVTTVLDTMPNAFNFQGKTNVQKSSTIYSETVTPNGYDGPLGVSISGEGNPRLSINGGSWVTSSNMNPGDSLQIRLTSSANDDQVSTCTLTLGDYSTNWNVRTSWCSGPNVYYDSAEDVCWDTDMNRFGKKQKATNSDFPPPTWTGDSYDYGDWWSHWDYPAYKACDQLTLDGYSDWRLASGSHFGGRTCSNFFTSARGFSDCQDSIGDDEYWKEYYSSSGESSFWRSTTGTLNCCYPVTREYYIVCVRTNE